MSGCCGYPFVGEQAFNPNEVRLYGRPCQPLDEDKVKKQVSAKLTSQLASREELGPPEQSSKISSIVAEQVANFILNEEIDDMDEVEDDQEGKQGKEDKDRCKKKEHRKGKRIRLKSGKCSLVIDAGHGIETSSLGVIYGYAYEGHCYKLPRPRIMYLPVCSHSIPNGDCGCECGYDSKLGYEVWSIDKLERVIVLDIRSDDLKTLILDENMPGNRSPLAYSQTMALAPQRARD